LEKANIISHIVYDKLTITFSYELTNPIMRAIAAYEAKVLEMTYTDKTAMSIAIRRSKLEEFKSFLIEVTGGVVQFATLK